MRWSLSSRAALWAAGLVLVTWLRAAEASYGQECGSNEVWLDCGSRCKEGCPSDQGPAECSEECEPGCFCAPGLVRHGGGCVEPGACPLDRGERAPTGDVFRCPAASGDHASTVLLCSQSYYRCEGWTSKKLYCKEDWVFDAQARACKPIDEVPECQFYCEKDDRSMHALGCSPYFWWCHDGKPSKNKCRPLKDVVTYFNPANDQCDFRSNVVACQGREDFIEVPVKPSGSPRPTSPRPTTPTPATHVRRQHLVYFAPVDCRKLVTGNFPNPHEPCADHFYQCSNSEAFYTPCFEGLYYDASTDACLERKNVPACNGQPYSPPAKRLNDDPLPEAPPAKPYQQARLKYPMDCSDKADGPYADPTALCAGHYYVCDHQTAVYMPCPPSLYYNPQANQCLRWNEVPECVSGGVTPTTTTTTSAPVPLPDEEPAIPAPTPGTSGQALDCSSLADGNYADPASPCSSTFVTCSNRLRIVRPCPADLFFDAGSNSCLRQTEVPACGGVRPERKSDTAPPMCPQPDGVFAHPFYRCNRAYIICRGGRWERTECQVPGHVFDPDTKVCADKARVLGCDSDFCVGKENGARFPAGPKCSANFITCVHGVAVYQPCPSPLAFSPLTGRCEYAADVPACGIERIQDSVQTSVQTVSGAQQPALVASVSEGVVDQGGPTRLNQDLGTACSKLADGDYELAPCSNQYRSCSAGVERVRACQEGLVFDAASNRCDTPDQLPQCQSQGQARQPSTSAPRPTSPAAADAGAQFADGFCSNLPDGHYKTAPCSAEVIYCDKGRPKLTRCSPGDAFDGTACLPQHRLAACNAKPDTPIAATAVQQPPAGDPSMDPLPQYLRSWYEQVRASHGHTFSPAELVAFLHRRGQESGIDWRTAHPRVYEWLINFLNSKRGHGADQPPLPILPHPGQPQPGTAAPPYNHFKWPSQGPTDEGPDEPDNVCEGKADGWKTSEGPCSAHYKQCRRGRLTSMQCPDQHVFDRDLGQCQLPHLVRECADPRQPTHGDDEAEWCSDKADGPYAKAQCSKDYVKCLDGRAQPAQCPKRHVFDPVRQRCEHSANVPSCNLPRPGPSSTSGGQYPATSGGQYPATSGGQYPATSGGRYPVVPLDGPGGQCPHANEEYSKCGSACEPSCSDPKPRCSERCVAGCHCKPGFIRSIDDACVPAGSCPGGSSPETEGSCDANEEMKDCANCEASCEEPSPNCEQTACKRGCACRTGYIRSEDDRCIPSYFCEFYAKRTRVGLGSQSSEDHSCNDGHGHKCDSARGSKEKCPGTYERFSRCGAGCQPTCFHKTRCDRERRRRCVPGCVCLDGHYRSHTGACVPAAKCFEVPPPPRDSESDSSDNYSDKSVSAETVSQEDEYRDFCLQRKTGSYKLGPCSASFVYCKHRVAYLIECDGCEIFDGNKCVPCRDKRQCRNECRKLRSCDQPTSDQSDDYYHGPRHRRRRHSASHEFVHRFGGRWGLDHCHARPDGFYSGTPCQPDYLQCHHGHAHWRKCKVGHVFEEHRRRCIPAQGSACQGALPYMQPAVVPLVQPYFAPEPVVAPAEPIPAPEPYRPRPRPREYPRPDISTDEPPSYPQPSTMPPMPSTPAPSYGYGQLGQYRPQTTYQQASVPRPGYGGWYGSPGHAPGTGYGQWQPGDGGQYRAWNASGPAWPWTWQGQWHLRPQPAYYTMFNYAPRPMAYGSAASFFRPPGPLVPQFPPAPVMGSWGGGRLPMPAPFLPEPAVPWQHSRVVIEVDGICRGLVDGSPVSLGKCKRNYAECSGGQALPRVCVDLTQIYDDVTKGCINRDDEPLCRVLPPAPTPARPAGDLAQFCMSKEDGYYAHPANCTNFIQCHRKATFTFKCSQGLVFNAREGVKACDYPRNVPGCAAEGSSVDRECEGLADGAFLRHPSDCSKYRRCVHGRLVVQDCPAGLVFNTQLSVCDYQSNVPECNR